MGIRQSKHERPFQTESLPAADMRRKGVVMCAMFALFIHPEKTNDPGFALEGTGEQAQIE
jgi:hypothetical protein